MAYVSWYFVTVQFNSVAPRVMVRSLRHNGGNGKIESTLSVNCWNKKNTCYGIHKSSSVIGSVGHWCLLLKVNINIRTMWGLKYNTLSKPVQSLTTPVLHKSWKIDISMEAFGEEKFTTGGVGNQFQTLITRSAKKHYLHALLEHWGFTEFVLMSTCN